MYRDKYEENRWLFLTRINKTMKKFKEYKVRIVWTISLMQKKNSVFHGRQSLCIILSLSIEFFNWGSHRLTTRVSLNFEDCDTLTIPRKLEHMPPWTHAFNMCTHISKCSKFQLKRQHYLSIQKELRWNVFVSRSFAFLACPFFVLSYFLSFCSFFKG